MSVNKQAYKANPFQTELVSNATFVIGAETANVINVAIQLMSGQEEVARKVALNAYISSNADGSTLVATAPTTVAIAVDGVLIPLIAGKSFLLVSEADGDIDINITLSAGAATYFLVLVLPDGTLRISGAISFLA